MKLTQLKKNLDQKLKTFPGTYALAFKSLENPQELILINEKENHHAASTMKIPLMIAVYKKVYEVEILLDDAILIKNNFNSVANDSMFSLDFAEDGEKIYTNLLEGLGQ